MRLLPLLPLMLLLAALPLLAEREPVLKQVDVPHPYYWREMYIPQLTTGPSSVAWMPDSKTLVYSMAGSLWRQELGSETASELTAGPGYDYQPDVSPDGRWILYTKYNADALELWVYDVQAQQAHALTKTGAVNVEPRFSPDGSRVVFVSTQFNRRFHIFIADFDAASGITPGGQAGALSIGLGRIALCCDAHARVGLPLRRDSQSQHAGDIACRSHPRLGWWDVVLVLLRRPKIAED